MLTYTYVAYDGKTGQKIKAELEAENEQEASRLLTTRGLSPLEITAKGAATGIGAFKEHVPTKQKVIFSRQMSTLINAGLPLVQSLSTVQKQTSNATLKDVIGQIVNDVEAGSTLATAMAKHPKLFDDVYISLVAAGETSGTLDASLERLANQQEKDAEVLSKVRGALIYPLIVLGVLFGVLTFMSVAVLPQVQSLYNQLPGARLPIITRFLLAISHFITHYWWITLFLIVLVVVVVVRWMRTTNGKETVDHLKLHAWLLSPLFMKLYMARFTRTASTLVASGVPMIQMLDTTARAVGNIHVARSIKKAAEQVKGGKSLSESLKGDPNFTELVPNMINIGEQSGSLEGMLIKVADYYEKDLDNQIKEISTIIEPVLMVVVGIIALIVVAAVLLPIYSLAGKNLIHQ